jgi:periplasmic divalent cation tolerance protein
VAEVVVLVTTASEEEAAQVGQALVKEGLVACANIVPGIRSIFRWEGKIEEEAECLLVLKSQRDHFEQLSKRVKELHSYSVPEIIALPIVDGLPEYLAWLRDMTPLGGAG